MIKTIAVLAKNDKGKLASIFIVSMLEAFFSFIPLVVLYFILCDIIDDTFSFELLGIYTAIIAGSALLRICFSYLSITYSRNNGNKMVKRLRMRIGEHIRKLPLGYFNATDMGELSAGLLDNVNKIEMITAMILPEIVSTLSLSLMVAAGLFWVEPRMALATVVTMPISLCILIWAGRIMAVRGKALYASSFRLSSALLEFVSGIKFIKSFNRSSKKLDELVERMADFKEKSLRTEGTLSPVMVMAGISIDLGLVMIIMIGSYLMIGGSLSGKTFIVFLVVSSRFFDNLKSLSVNYVKVKYLGIAGKAVRRILAEKIPSGNDAPQLKRHDIEFDNVRFSYDEKEVVRGVNLYIKENTLTAFVGPSGSGKTTLAHLIARFYDPASGGITIGGHRLTRMDPEAVLKNISMVFQKVFLFNDTIYNNIKIGRPGATREEITAAARKAGAHEFIASLPNGYDTLVGENGATLSGGEQQRISIARAVVKDAPIVLLDEATASLDPENEIFIQKAVSNLLENKTVIVIAHRLKTVKDADKIVVLNNGRIEEEGVHESLLSRGGLYRRMWDKQQAGSGWQIKS